ncbi:DUF4468 domain-containing protein [Sphingobacterium hotanense]|uniref:DUF4468 domain-containing protein n=1 Tax=Sphingobacterium hotanense TaxID=649196 RepID=A0ABT7NQK3_9SPHI|nr:DUF4468 domain-containing protein [Sphingobacterium hotanense]MDM1049507.1 DUF4468 domain-containing protein [Sphingobacterium hotanense]
MKNLFIFLVFIPFFSVAQDLPIVDDKIVYEKIIDAPGMSKSELYAASKRFVANAVRSAKSVIQTEDEGTGLIICKGNVTLQHARSRMALIVPGRPVGGTKYFTMQFESKEGRCRVRIYDIFEDNTFQPYDRNYSLEEIFFDLASRTNSSKGKTQEKRKTLFNESVTIVNNAFFGLIHDFERSINNYKNNDDW